LTGQTVRAVEGPLAFFAPGIMHDHYHSSPAMELLRGEH
jgi:hypothetical protein